MRKKSAILEAVHESAQDLYESGLINQEKMQEFDRLCMRPEPVQPLSPEKIKQIRLDANVSQAIFATFLNTSVSTVQKWEIGNKKPSGIALKMLHLVQKKGLEVCY